MARTKKNTVPAALETVELPPIEQQTLTVIEGSDGLELTEEEIAALNDEMNAGTGIDNSEDEVQADAGTEDQSDEDQVPTEDDTVVDFETAKAQFLAEAGSLEMNRNAIARGFDERGDYETTKNPNNETIHKSLGKSRAKLIQEQAVAALAVAGVSPDFMTWSSHEGSAYNVYAIDKLCDLVGALNTGVMRNAVNLAIAKSLMNLKEIGEAMTGEFSKACVSKNIRVQGNGAKVLYRHTASPATAPTQASSTMQALQTLGIVANTGSQKYPVYALTDTPASVRMQEVLSA